MPQSTRSCTSSWAQRTTIKTCACRCSSVSTRTSRPPWAPTSNWMWIQATRSTTAWPSPQIESTLPERKRKFQLHNNHWLVLIWLWCFVLHSEETDKVYFRKKDEMTNYTEFMFKSKILLAKKWASLAMYCGCRWPEGAIRWSCWRQTLWGASRFHSTNFI